MKNFLKISEISSKDLKSIIRDAKKRKKDREGFMKSKIDKPFKDKIMIMIFEQPSTRTRISFDLAVKQLGGSSIILEPDNIHYGKGNESLKDTAKVLSCYSDIVMLRTSEHENLERFSKYLKIPIINGLSNDSHPCQVLSDILTFEEVFDKIEGKTIAWVGDGNNNMSNSYIEAATKFNFNLNIACPKEYSPSKKILNWAKKNKTLLNVTDNPVLAVKNADCVMTDKWVSMSDKVNVKKKKNKLKKYQVNKKLMEQANKDAIFMHCLPVGRNEEVTEEVIDGKKSVILKQATNRIHAQKSIIKWCLD